MSKRIKDPDHKFLGVIVVGAKLAYFQPIYQSIASLHSQFFMLAHRDGTIIVRYPDPQSRALTTRFQQARLGIGRLPTAPAIFARKAFSTAKPA